MSNGKYKVNLIIPLVLLIVLSSVNVKSYAEELPNTEQSAQSEETQKEFDKNNILQLKVTKTPYKVNYLEGDYFDPLGMEVTLTDNNNLIKTITHYDFKDYDIKIIPSSSLKTTDIIIEVHKGDLKDYFKVTVTKNIINKEILQMIREIAVSLDTRNKTEGSVAVLNRAINYANDVLRFPSSTEKEIQTAINDLKNAITSLRDINTSFSDFNLSINSLKIGDTIIEGRTEPYYEVSIKVNRNKNKTIDADKKGDFSLKVEELKEGDKVEIIVSNDRDSKTYKSLEINITKEGSKTSDKIETEEVKQLKEAIELLERQYNLGSINATNYNPNLINTSTSNFLNLLKNSKNGQNILTHTFTNGINSYTEQFNGKTREFTMDIEPIIKNGELMVPLRYVAYSLNARIYYKIDTKEIFIYKDNRTIYIHAETGFAKDSIGNIFIVKKPLILNKRVLINATDIPAIFNYYNIEIQNDIMILYK